MPATTRTRPTRASRAARLPAATQPGIQHFTRAGKAGTGEAAGKGALSLKRKVAELEESGIESSSTPEPKTRKKKLSAQETGPSTQATAESLLEQHLERSSSASSDGDDDQSVSPSPVSSPASSVASPPPYLQSDAFRDFTRLHSSLLNALFLHYAHNGPMAPANLKELFPTIERIWKKRKVTIEDIRRVLFIQDATPSVYAMPDIPKFRISNYGTRHVIERMDSAARHSEKPLKEAELTVLFLRNLEAFWRSQPEKPVDADLTQDIPLAPIHTSGSTGSSQKAMRQRLLDIQGGTMRYKPTETSEKTEDARIAASGSDSLLSRKSSLLSRLQAKGLRQSTLVPPPSKEAILRRSAAERLPEVINVLLLLSPPMPNTDDGDQIPNFTPKKAFSMPTIIQNIRDSMRNPISKQEAEMCFDLLSRREVAGDWITIVTVKRLKSVVIRGGRNIPTQEIMKQVADMTF